MMLLIIIEPSICWLRISFSFFAVNKVISLDFYQEVNLKDQSNFIGFYSNLIGLL